MKKISVFNVITLDGYFEGPNRNLSWTKHGAEEDEFAIEGLKSRNTLLFGRVTYEIMASYWPTPNAIKYSPLIADGMKLQTRLSFLEL
jgi:dihydrofolate reductase